VSEMIDVEQINFVRDDEGTIEVMVTFAVTQGGRAGGFNIPIKVPNTGDLTTDIEVAKRHLHLLAQRICEATSAAVN